MLTWWDKLITTLSFKSFNIRHIAIAALLMCVAMLSACGFKLKGTTNLPFDTMYTNIDLNTAFGNSLSRYIMASSPGLRFVDDPTQADVRLTQLVNNQTRREMSLDAEGHVEEYELILNFTFQLTDKDGRVILPPTNLVSIREIPYDPDESQAKAGEIAMTFEEMSQSLITRIIRILDSPDISNSYTNRQSNDFETDLYYDDEHTVTLDQDTISTPDTTSSSQDWEVE